MHKVLDGTPLSEQIDLANSILRCSWPTESTFHVSVDRQEDESATTDRLNRILNVRDSAKRLLETARTSGHIGGSVDASLSLYVVDGSRSALEESLRWFEEKETPLSERNDSPSLAELTVTSSFSIVNATQGDESLVLNKENSSHSWTLGSWLTATGEMTEEKEGAVAFLSCHSPRSQKCGRCWRWLAPSSGALCSRCASALGD